MSLEKIQGFYKALAKSTETMAKNKLKAAETLNSVIPNLRGYRFDETHFDSFWPLPPTIYFEHFESGLPLKSETF